MPRSILLLFVFALFASSCVKTTTKAPLEDVRKLPGNVGLVKIDMRGTWEVTASRAIAVYTPLPKSSGGLSNTDFFRIPIVGSKLVFDENNYAVVNGRKTAQENTSTPNLVTKKYFNQSNGQYAVFHLTQETGAEGAGGDHLVCWIVAGSYEQGRMIGRVSYDSLQDGTKYLGDWLFEMRKTTSLSASRIGR